MKNNLAENYEFRINYRLLNAKGPAPQHLIIINNGVGRKAFTKFSDMNIYASLPQDTTNLLHDLYFKDDSGRKIVEGKFEESALVSLLKFDGGHMSKVQRNLLNSFIPVPVEE